jgi:hypothetical protein
VQLTQGGGQTLYELVDDEQKQVLPNGELRVIDQFEITARNGIAKAGFALQARASTELLPDIDAVVFRIEMTGDRQPPNSPPRSPSAVQ